MNEILVKKKKILLVSEGESSRRRFRTQYMFHSPSSRFSLLLHRKSSTDNFVHNYLAAPSCDQLKSSHTAAPSPNVQCLFLPLYLFIPLFLAVHFLHIFFTQFLMLCVLYIFGDDSASVNAVQSEDTQIVTHILPHSTKHHWVAQHLITYTVTSSLLLLYSLKLVYHS